MGFDVLSFELPEILNLSRPLYSELPFPREPQLEDQLEARWLSRWTDIFGKLSIRCYEGSDIIGEQEFKVSV